MKIGFNVQCHDGIHTEASLIQQQSLHSTRHKQSVPNKVTSKCIQLTKVCLTFFSTHTIFLVLSYKQQQHFHHCRDKKNDTLQMSLYVKHGISTAKNTNTTAANNNSNNTSLVFIYF